MNDDAVTEGNSAHFSGLVDALIQGWSASTVPASTDSSEVASRTSREPVLPRAYLLFNRCEENPLVQGLADQFSKWMRDRVIVPDGYFEHREEHAPVLLELPEELIAPTPGFKTGVLRAWLARCLEFAAQQANERVTKQDFCGVVISPASPQAIVRHWVNLGDQRPPREEDSVLFRYQDPRVMQRVWPALSSSQQARWLGPVTHWWSVMQPWGPFSDPAAPAQWFHAKAPVPPHGIQAGSSPCNLFNEAQWFLSGVSPDANSIWRSYADNNIPVEVQPDPDSLLQMLADAARMGLQELNLEDYVWITWKYMPKEGAARAMDWKQPHLDTALSRIQELLRDQPDVRFSTHFINATRR
ncbi:hypothetical protein DBV14_13430 [Variovorax sp. KBW07]|uniref:DUF4123 domain-containing protein n=1 Tax=Variovorax sp. KBW07 TaxID=2153358 RepID=UPI000F56A6D7|nr:DUF4123 domain-containing protein [Variovorax sp. KBW07]RQO53779.1 hypothetical protein DBV14_13430 [Variovorax sp. KBW07]